MSQPEPRRTAPSRSPTARQPGGNTTESSSIREQQGQAAVQEVKSPAGQLPSLASLSAAGAPRQGLLSSLLNTSGAPYGQDVAARSPSGVPAGFAARSDPHSGAQAPYSSSSAAIETNRYSLPPAEAYRGSPSSFATRSPRTRAVEYGMPPPHMSSATAAKGAAASPARSMKRESLPPPPPPQPPPQAAPHSQQSGAHYEAQYPSLPPPPSSSGPPQHQYAGFDPRFRFPPSQGHQPSHSHTSQVLSSPTEMHYAHTPTRSAETARHQGAREDSVGHGHGEGSSQSNILMSETGPLSFPIDHQAASRVADEKRRRNAGASARFRARRKEKEQQNTREIDDLKQKIRDLEEDADFYRHERDYFVSVLINSPERDRYFPRPASPRRRRPARAVVEEGYASYEEHGERGGEDRTARRRLTGDYHTSQSQEQGRGQLPPPPPPPPPPPSAPPAVALQQQQQATSRSRGISQYGHPASPSQHRHYASAPPQYGQGLSLLHPAGSGYGQAPSYPPPPPPPPPHQYYYSPETHRGPGPAGEARAGSLPYETLPPPGAMTSHRAGEAGGGVPHAQGAPPNSAGHTSSASWTMPRSQR